jgi:hypothetical protein
MNKYTQSFWRLFCFSFAKKMTKSTLRSAFFMGNQLTTESTEKALRAQRESEEREHRDALRAWEFIFDSESRAFRLHSMTLGYYLIIRQSFWKILSSKFIQNLFQHKSQYLFRAVIPTTEVSWLFLKSCR